MPEETLVKPVADGTRPMARQAAQLPAWYPAWAVELAQQYFSGTTCVFVVHGNVHDLMDCPTGSQSGYCSLSEFLGTQLFGRWDIVLNYDLSRGLRPLAGSHAERLRSMMQYLSARWGEPANWPRDPDKVLLLLDGFLERILVDDVANRKSIALLFDYAQYLVSAGSAETVSRGQAARLVQLLSWAQNPHIRRVNMAFCLIADRLAELSDRLVQSPYVATIEIPLPDRSQRLRFIESASRSLLTQGDDSGSSGVWPSQPDTNRAEHESEKPPNESGLGPWTDYSADQLADMSNGLSLVDLNVVLSQAVRSERRLDAARFRQLKKSMIERQCQGLVEFVEPAHTLDLVVGYAEAKKRLQEDAARISRGQLDTAPMGYLVCGPVGTGKTFLAECYAGSIGIPCVVLKNFRSKYVGETEGNLQQVLTVLRSLGPVVVIVDEADAALGNRQAEGDSGTSARVFSMIASQMGNTRFRGKIIWMLLTSRPDLLPIDLKRQGRAEVHIPLLYPQDPAEIRAMFETMAKKNKLKLAPDAVPEVSAERRLTGADIESIVLAARRSALTGERSEIVRADLEEALEQFIPSAQGLEKELQELAAVLECTQRSFLPPEWQKKVSQPDGRTRLQERMVAIRQLLEQ